MARATGELDLFVVRGEIKSPVTASVWSDNALTVVGMVVGRRELWLPNDPGSYKGVGGYNNGYDRDEAVTRRLRLGNMADKFTRFFEEFLIGRGWAFGLEYQEGEEIKYNCDGVALWLTGQQEDWDLKAAKGRMEATIEDGSRLRTELLELGGIAAIGARKTTTHRTVSMHSYAALGGGMAVQASGAHGTVVISSEHESRAHYSTRWHHQMYGLEVGELQTYSQAASLT